MCITYTTFMLDFVERAVPGISANYLLQEALARYIFASKYIKNNSNVMDIGSGAGYGVEYLSRKANVIGVDNNVTALKYARKHYPRSIFKRGNAQKLNFADEKFDVVTSFEVIEHLREPMRYLKEIKRILSINGIFVLSTPNADYPQATSSPFHIREYSKNELKQMLMKEFTEVEIFGQQKNKKAKEAFKMFLLSQNARQRMVDTDKIGFRKLLPRTFKEWTWKYLGNFFGRSYQNQLTVSDFPISRKITVNTEYFIALCKK